MRTRIDRVVSGYTSSRPPKSNCSPWTFRNICCVRLTSLVCDRGLVSCLHDPLLSCTMSRCARISMSSAPSSIAANSSTAVVTTVMFDGASRSNWTCAAVAPGPPARGGAAVAASAAAPALCPAAPCNARPWPCSRGGLASGAEAAPALG